MSIEIKNLSYIYNKGTAFEQTAIHDINISIQKGEFIGLIGHTGSGKSTLIQHLNALLKPSTGHILLDGEDINADSSKLKRIRQRVGLVFQYPEHQLFEMTVYKDVAFGPENMGLSKEETDKRVKAALENVGVDESIHEKSPFELSGGQKRRVAIAGVLAMEPEVLVLDEPAAGLDPRGRDEVLGLIKSMHSNLGITVILVSHSMEDVSRLVNRVIVMHQGRIAMDGALNEVFSRVEEVVALGLRAPSISYLMKGLNERGFGLPQDIYKVEDAVDCLLKVFQPGVCK